MTNSFSVSKILAICTTAIVVLVCGYGLYLSGSPSKERARVMDTNRVNALQQISYAVDQYWGMKSALPASLDELQKTQNIYLQGIVDPETSTTYEYHANTVDTYQLCATFNVDGNPDGTMPPPPQTYPVNGSASLGFWQHPAGHYCYTLNVNKPPKPL